MDMADVTALLERRCGSWNDHAVFMLRGQQALEQ
jgi:hypothetical protein